MNIIYYCTDDTRNKNNNIHDLLVHYIPTIREVNTDEFVIETQYYH